MQQRLLLQLLAIVLAILVVAALTLTVMGKLEPLTFWIITGVVFLLSYALYRNPK